jgi:hypothetical protein
MSSMSAVRRYGVSLFVAAGLISCLAAPAAAQVVVNGAFDVTNQYSFRGIRQNTDGVALWPYFDVGGTVYKGKGGLKAVALDAGMWNSFNSQIKDFTNLDGTVSSNKWYEADYFGSVALGLGGNTTFTTLYTSYTSPGNYWHHIKEVSFKLGVDDSGKLGKASLKPYAQVAFELTDTGQADAGAKKGVYVELGVSPGYAGKKASISVPIKVGLSGKDYYEFGYGTDSKFGYFGASALVTVPMNAHWNVHGSVGVEAYGDNLKRYNAYGTGDRAYQGIVLGGIGFTY